MGQETERINAMTAAKGRFVCLNPHCRCEFTAKIADRKRGWARHCSKACAAWTREKKKGFAGFARREREPEGEFSNAHLFSNEEHDCNKE